MGKINVVDRAQELCGSRGGRPGLPVHSVPSLACERRVKLSSNSMPSSRVDELRARESAELSSLDLNVTLSYLHPPDLIQQRDDANLTYCGQTKNRSYLPVFAMH